MRRGALPRTHTTPRRPLRRPERKIKLPRRKTSDYQRLSVHLPRPLLDLLHEIAAREDRPISTTARRMIEAGLEAQGYDVTWRAVADYETPRRPDPLRQAAEQAPTPYQPVQPDAELSNHHE